MYVGAVSDAICVVWVCLTKGNSGDGCALASTVCKCDLFVLRWARVGRGSISSELLMYSGDVCSIY